ncbi:class I SAM-dependent methyltransferase [Oscillatoriales cyanobacterium LEGE 11467]|uniref:Class I SAM-dependent methyltransferase n=2 Tax=Zarconia TaxID=2992130 RepID=A0A928VU39_9CYAN|nr:class I SAM-dependent methyltransferase [Zarconia navalis LEGE 11467]
MQQSPPFLDSRGYGKKMGALFEGLVRGTAESSSTPRNNAEQIATSPVSSYQSIKPAVDAIEGFLVPGQEKYLFDKVKSMPEDATIVEIGSFRGRSTVAMAYACVGTKRKIYCIDPWNFKGSKSFPENMFEIWTENIKRNGLDSYVTPLKGYSRDILSRWPELAGNQQIDFIFIDGGHEYEDVLPDFQLAFPLVKPGGWIALHDVRAGFPGVDRVWVENASVALTHHEFCSTIACGRKPAIAPTQASPKVSPPDLNRLLGCVNLYEIDPSNTSIVSELSQLRRQLAEYFLSLPTAELETVYKGELGNVYRAFLKSGFQTQPVPESDRPFVQQLTQQGAGFTHPGALNAFLGVMLYYAPGTMKVQDPQTRLPGWLIEDYEGVFESV